MASPAQKSDRKPLRRVPGLGAGAEAGAFDRLVHERTRLAIVTALAVNEALTFTELKKLLGATDGNLSVHARKLEEGGLIQCTKSFVGRTPQTEYRLSKAGRRALENYVGHMDALVKALRRS